MYYFILFIYFYRSEYGDVEKPLKVDREIMPLM